MGWKPTPFSFTPLQEVSDGILQDFAEQHLDISMRFVDLYQLPLRNLSRNSPGSAGVCGAGGIGISGLTGA